MQIITMPDNYRGAFSELIYTLAGAGTQQTVEVAVLGERDDDILGIKRFRGYDTFSVNISNYMCRRAMAEPLDIAGCTATSVPGRTVAGRIRVEDTVSPPRLFTAGVKAAQELTPLSDRPSPVRIAPGEKDEVAIIVPAGKTATLRGVVRTDGDRELIAFQNTLTGDGTMAVQIVDMDHIVAAVRQSGCPDGLNAVELHLDSGQQSTMLRRYEPAHERSNTMRLCWLNPYGAIDYYTFALCGAQTVSAEKSRIYTETGFKVYGSAARKSFTLYSDYEDPRTMEWLSQILCSPKVWIAGPEGGFTPADIATNHMKINHMEPSLLCLEVKENMKTTFQKF